MHVTELLGLLTSQVLLELWLLIYLKPLAVFGMLVFINSRLLEFRIRCLTLLLLFSKCDQESYLRLELVSDFNLTHETLWTEVRTGFLISVLKKLNLFGLFLRKTIFYCSISIAKTVPKKIRALIRSLKFLSS